MNIKEQIKAVLSDPEVIDFIARKIEGVESEETEYNNIKFQKIKNKAGITEKLQARKFIVDNMTQKEISFVLKDIDVSNCSEGRRNEIIFEQLAISQINVILDRITINGLPCVISDGRYINKQESIGLAKTIKETKDILQENLSKAWQKYRK